MFEFVIGLVSRFSTLAWKGDDDTFVQLIEFHVFSVTKIIALAVANQVTLWRAAWMLE